MSVQDAVRVLASNQLSGPGDLERCGWYEAGVCQDVWVTWTSNQLFSWRKCTQSNVVIEAY